MDLPSTHYCPFKYKKNRNMSSWKQCLYCSNTIDGDAPIFSNAWESSPSETVGDRQVRMWFFHFKNNYNKNKFRLLDTGFTTEL